MAHSSISVDARPGLRDLTACEGVCAADHAQMTTAKLHTTFLSACIALTALLSSQREALAQTKDDGALWLQSINQGKFGEKDSPLAKWRWWLEAQGRWRDNGETFDTGIFRPGIGYAITDRVIAHVGYAFIDNEPENRPVVHENRVWQQLTWNVPVEGFTLQSRTRLEERFIVDESDTGWRLRQFFKATVPVVEDKTTFVSAWEEMFWDLDDTDWGQRTGFRQNRAFLGLGQFFDEKKSISIEVGYLNQWIDRPGEDRLNHVLLVCMFMTF